MWRPEGWESPHKNIILEPGGYNFSEPLEINLDNAYEAGADAMLEVKEKDTQDRIARIDANAGDDKAFRLMVLAEFIPEEVNDDQ